MNRSWSPVSLAPTPSKIEELICSTPGVRVKYASRNAENLLFNKEGTVIGIMYGGDTVSVRWDEENRYSFHNCNGLCEDFHGYNVSPQNLRHIPPLNKDVFQRAKNSLIDNYRRRIESIQKQITNMEINKKHYYTQLSDIKKQMEREMDEFERFSTQTNLLD